MIQLLIQRYALFARRLACTTSLFLNLPAGSRFGDLISRDVHATSYRIFKDAFRHGFMIGKGLKSLFGLQQSII